MLLDCPIRFKGEVIAVTSEINGTLLQVQAGPHQS